MTSLFMILPMLLHVCQNGGLKLGQRGAWSVLSLRYSDTASGPQMVDDFDV